MRYRIVKTGQYVRPWCAIRSEVHDDVEEDKAVTCFESWERALAHAVNRLKFTPVRK